jgi:hypothetical protein
VLSILPDDVKSVTLEVVDRPSRQNSFGVNNANDSQVPMRLHLAEQGFAVSRACEGECITYSRLRFRVTRSTRLQERLKEAEATRFKLSLEEALESSWRPTNAAG